MPLNDLSPVPDMKTSMSRFQIHDELTAPDDSAPLIKTIQASGGAVTITLPAAAGVKGRIYHIKKTDSSLNLLTIDGNGAETIDGSTTVNTTTQYHSFTLVCDGSSWWMI